MVEAHTLAGLVGLAISIPLWMVTSWRLSFHFARGMAPPTHFWTLRRRFHLLLWCATIVEACAYADFAGLLAPLGTNISDKVGYILLDLLGRSIFEFLAFSTITELWLQTALQASPMLSEERYQGALYLRTLNRFLAAITVLLSGSLASKLLWDTETLVQFEKETLIFRLQILMESICWAVGTAFVVVCVRVNNERIQMNFATFPPDTGVERFSLQSQALVPMVMCGVCYALRSLFLLCRLVGESPIFVATTRFHPVWWVAFVWAPTLLVVLMALYSARRRDRHVLSDPNSDPTDPDNYMPLLPSVPPPAEAFRNFRLFADGVVLPFSSPRNQNSSSSLDVSATNLGDSTQL